MEKSPAIAAPQNYVVKIIFGDEKRIVLLDQPSYDLLANKVAATLGLAPGSFALRYRDDEKDLITASSDEELQLALNFAASSGILHMQVCLLQPLPFGEKRRRESASGRLEVVDAQAVAFLVQQMHEKGFEVKPKKCAKFLHRTHGDVAMALAFLDAWCVRRAAKDQKKREKKAFKQEYHEHDVATESPELKEKLDQLEARGHLKRGKNAKLLAKCGYDLEKVLEVLHCKAAKKEAKEQWKSVKKARKCDRKVHKRDYKLERRGCKSSYKHYKKHLKREAKELKRQHLHSYQELSVASSPMTVV